MAGSDSSGVEEMYRNFGVLADAGDKISEVCWGGERGSSGINGTAKLCAREV